MFVPCKGQMFIAFSFFQFLTFDFFLEIYYDGKKMDKHKPDSQPITQLVADWKQKGLSTRASYVLAKAGISSWQLASYHDVEALICIKNCGSQTAQEIWNFMTNSERKVEEVKFEDLIPN